MKYSLKFIKKFVDWNGKPENLFKSLIQLGFNLESYEKLEDDILFELEITTNRPDLLSHLGISREIATFYGIELKKEKIDDIPVEKKSNLFEIEIEDTDLCPRYSAILIRDVKIAQSPPWLKETLEKIGIRSINNIVDISNYVLAYLGHPTHPFDFEKISDGKIIVRKPRKGETIRTLDGVERKLEGEELLICDSKKPIALAGIMGGQETEVTEYTKMVLIESAYFNPKSIRKTSKKFNLQTEASIRFSRGADIESTITAINLISKLVREFNCGIPEKFIIDVYPDKIKLPEIRFSLLDLNRFFDLNFDEDWVAYILKSLGFKVNLKEKEFIVIPPSYRQDVKEDVDIFEEIGRFYGYDKLPQKMPEISTGISWEIDENELVKRTQDIFSSFGLIEIISYIFSKEEEINNFDSVVSKNPIKITNPLKSDENYLRRSLIPGLLRTYINNWSKNVYDVNIFEVGKIYFEENGKYFEENFAGVLVSGRILEYFKSQLWDFYRTKGLFEEFLYLIGAKDYEFKPKPLKGFYENGSAIIEVEGKIVGIIGQISFESKYPIWAGEISLNSFLKTFKEIRKIEPVSNFPYIEIDMTIGHPAEFSYKNIIEAIKEFKPENLLSISFKDRYIKVGKIYTTITLRFQSFERSLKQEEINEIRENLAKHLISKYPITF